MVEMCFEAKSGTPADALISASDPAIATTGSGRVWRSDTKRTMLISPEIFIGLELSLVSEVECVYVERIGNRKDLRVMIIVNERDPKVRARVYAREQEIIEAHPHLDFDFYLHARMDRNLEDVVDGIGVLAFKRFRG